MAVFLARVPDAGTSYQLQVGRLGGTYSGADPSPIAGESLAFLVAVIERVGQ